MGATEVTPVHDPAAQRWTVDLEGHRAQLDYRLSDGIVDIRHTRVPEPLGGRGIAGRLVEAAVAWARDNGYRVRPSCSYAAAWMERHPEHSDLLAQ
jgi:predicted GNAT family acetyltransferase